MDFPFFNTTHVILYMLFLYSINAFSQESIKDFKFEQNTIYIFSRGTRAKSGLIAEKFNSIDRKITHVGIGYFDADSVKIYNVTDVDSSKTALVIDSIDSFISSGTYYLSIWKCNTSEVEFLKLKECLAAFSKHKFYFDFSFMLNENDNVLYCSEFCSRVLKAVSPEKFNFKPKKMKLEFYYQALLKRKKLVYYPVDFFEESPYLTKIFEINLN